MDPLVALKGKLMIKPTIEERKRVEVVIKGTKKSGEDQNTETIIQIKTNPDFDRKALLKKLAESKKLKVTVKPIVEQSQRGEQEKKGDKEKEKREREKIHLLLCYRCIMYDITYDK